MVKLSGKATIINVEIENANGVFYASSPELPEMCLAHGDLTELYEGMPEAIEVIFASRGVDVRVLRTDDNNHRPMSSPLVAIPTGIAA